MAIFLVEDHIGADADTVGFPNLANCMALVVQTTTRLYGYHVFGLQVNDKTAQLLALIQQDEPQARMIHLYGSCNFPNRYASLSGTQLAPQWEQEMNDIANVLGYRGLISGFNIASWYSWDPAAKFSLSRIKPSETTFLEYRRQPTSGKCAIFYKRMSKMNTTTGDKPADLLVERIRRQRIGATSDFTYVRSGPHHNLTVLSASVQHTDRNRGELHVVPDHFIRTFNKR